MILPLRNVDPSHRMATVLDHARNEVAIVQNNGQAYLSMPEVRELYLRKGSGDTCQLAMDNPSLENMDILTFDVQCVAGH